MVDFLPPLTLQTALDRNLEFHYLEGYVSEQISKTKLEPVTTDLMSIKPNIGTRRGIQIEFGSPYDVEARLTQREAWDEVSSHAPDLPDVVIHNRYAIHDIPRRFEDFEPLQGADELYHIESSIGNFYRKYRRMRIPVVNPYRVMKARLLELDIIGYDDPVLKRIRGILRTKYILPSNEAGYEALYPIMPELQLDLVGEKFWKDVAIPYKLVGDPFDSTRITGYISISE
jgi:hypothetical protein